MCNSRFRGEARIAVWVQAETTMPLNIEFETAGAVLLHNGDTEAELLMLQGKPIGEPVAHYRPFVINSH